MKTIVITDSQVSAKCENILYIVTRESDSIKDIRSRMADCRDPDLYCMDFIPPQYFSRFTALRKFATELRQKNNSTKTQIRFGNHDLELWTKTKGTNERYEIVPLEIIEENNTLPKFDHTKKWTRKVETP